MEVKFWEPGKTYRKLKTQIDSAIERVLLNGQLVMGFGPDIQSFEENFARYLGVKHAIMCGGGTHALLLAYKAIDLKEGDEVITVSHTFIATIDQIKVLGAKPILVDIGKDGLMDVSKLEALVTPKTKAIVPVHLEGKVCDMDAILTLAKKYGLRIIEDSAQALGASYNGQKAGTIGEIGCFSLYPAKILGGIGNGGMVVTNDDALAEKLRMLRCNFNAGKNRDIENVDYGYQLEPDNIQAAVLNVKLPYLEQYLLVRKVIAERYDEAFRDLPIELPVEQQGRVYQDYVILVENPTALRDYLKEKGIGTLGVDLVPNHRYPKLNLRFNLPETERYLSKQIRLPCNPDLTTEELEYVIENVKNFYK